METDTGSAEQHSCCKIGRVVREYGLDELDTTLERQWTREDSASLRELQRQVNRRLLQAALAECGITPLDGEAENLRRLLNGSDVSESRRVEARRRLEGDGLDVESVVSDFVSHQTVYNHLRECRDVSQAEENSEKETLTQARSTIFGLQNRTEAVTEQTLSRLGKTDLLAPEEFDVVVDIQAICENCGRSYGVETLLTNGGCRCETE